MKGLVLSGGGSKGSYQCGALKYILGTLQVKYDIFCGVSVGAINVAHLSMYHVGQEKESIETLSELWCGLDNSKIYKRHFPFGRWHALWKQSFFDSSPLRDLLIEKIKLDKIRESGKKVSVGCVSLSSGKYTVFNQDFDDFIKAVLASASFPGMLTPVNFLNQLWIDGGMKELSPIKTAIDMGADDIDVIMTSPHVRTRHFIENPTTVDVLKRALDVSTDKIMSNDIEKVEMHNRLAKAGFPDKKFVKLNILRPENNLIEDLLDFRPHKISEMMQKGLLDAIAKYTM
jgi:NTE family protein